MKIVILNSQGELTLRVHENESSFICHVPKGNIAQKYEIDFEQGCQITAFLEPKL